MVMMVFVWPSPPGINKINLLSNLLQITLHNEMLDIRPAYHKPMSFLKVYAPELCLYRPTIPDNSNKYMEIFGWIRDACGDVKLMRKFRSKLHDRAVILPQVIDFMRRKLASDIRVGEEMGKCSTSSPIHVPQAIKAMGVVSKQTPFVSVYCSLYDQNSWRRRASVNEKRVDGFFEIALLTYDGSHKSVIIFEEGVRLC